MNIYQLNIFNNLLFLHWVKNGKVPNVFLSKFLRPSHHYPTSFSQNNHIVPSFKLTKSKYGTTIFAPKLWNIILNRERKLIEKYANFKAIIKTKLVLIENAVVYFWCIYKTLNSLTRISGKETRNYFRKTYQGLDDKTYTVFCHLIPCQLSYFTFFGRKFNIVTLLYIFFCLFISCLFV